MVFNFWHLFWHLINSEPLQTSTKELFTKTDCNINLMLLPILAKKVQMRFLDSRLGPGCSSAGGYNLVLSSSNGHISLAVRKDVINSLHMKFRLVSSLSITRPLKHYIKSNCTVALWGVFFLKIFYELLSNFHAFSIFFWTPDGGVWSIKVIPWETSSSRHSDNIQVATWKHKNLIVKS